MGDTVGANIRRIRKERGMTQIQLAERMFQDRRRQSYISSVERGSYVPDLPNLMLFADALLCAVSDIQPLVSYIPAALDRSA